MRVQVFCIKCGRRLSEGVKFCTYCGAAAYVASGKSEVDPSRPVPPKVTLASEAPLRPVGEPEWRLRLRGCRKCHKLPQPLVFIGEEGAAYPLFHEEGNLEAEILFVMEAPNYGDTFDPQKGRMTFGEDTDPTGRFFEECLRDEVGIGIKETMVVNSVLCLPASKDGKYPVRPEQLRLCSTNLMTIIESVDPRVVVTLGGHALQALKLIERHRLSLRDAVASPYKWFGRTLFPLYHPSSLGRVTRSSDEQRADYRALRRLVKGRGG